eukprot:6214792-Pleurochrysis_carterae.AAC.5
MSRRSAPHRPGCKRSFKLIEAQCCHSRCLDMLGLSDFICQPCAMYLKLQLKSVERAWSNAPTLQKDMNFRHTNNLCV